MGFPIEVRNRGFPLQVGKIPACKELLRIGGRATGGRGCYMHVCMHIHVAGNTARKGGGSSSIHICLWDRGEKGGSTEKVAAGGRSSGKNGLAWLKQAGTCNHGARPESRMKPWSACPRGGAVHPRGNAWPQGPAREQD